MSYAEVLGKSYGFATPIVKYFQDENLKCIITFHVVVGLLVLALVKSFAAVSNTFVILTGLGAGYFFAISANYLGISVTQELLFYTMFLSSFVFSFVVSFLILKKNI